MNQPINLCREILKLVAYIDLSWNQIVIGLMAMRKLKINVINPFPGSVTNPIKH